MLIGVLTVAVIALGLPLLAWWVGQRPFWARVESRSGPDPYTELVRRHRLRPAEVTEVHSALVRGRRLDDPRLRAAVVDWARTALTATTGAGARQARIRRFFVWFGALYALLVLATLVFSLAFGHGVPGSLWFPILNIVLTVGGPLRAQRNLRRAIRLNSDTPDPSGE